jgi:biotin carboxyl carrier protein
MKTKFDYNSQPYSIDLTPTGKAYTATIDGESYSVEVVRAANGQLDLLIDGKAVGASISSDGSKRWVTVGGQTFVLTKSSGGRKSSSHGSHAAGELVAPMPGQVRAVQVAEGDFVTKGQTLVIVEAMKMEIKIAAPRDGTVKSLKVRQGQTVERDQILVKIE